MSRNREGWNCGGKVRPAGAVKWEKWIAAACCTVWAVISAAAGMSANAETVGSVTQEISLSGTDGNSITQESAEGGVHVSKSLIDNEDGTLQIELGNYVEGQTVYGAKAADIVLLLDVSASMNWMLTEDVARVTAMEEAALEFIDTLVEHNSSLAEEDQNRLAIVTFSKTAKILCGFTAVNEDSRETLDQYVSGLTCSGGTYTDVAFQKIQSALFDTETDESRERVVVFFTDGYPCGKDSSGVTRGGLVLSVANRTLALAQTMKSDGTVIYAISIHPLAQSDYEELPTYEKIEEDYYLTPDDIANGESGTATTSNENAAALANRFMYLISSCNPDAVSVDDDGKTTGDNGEIYYYTAGDTEELNEVFRTVAESVGTASAELDSSTTITDIVTEDYVIADADQVRVYTSAYNGDGTWGERTDITDTGAVSVEVTERQVTVGGFDYSANYVSSSPHVGTDSDYGCQLIVSFPIVPVDTFGGNQIETNEESSGIYAAGEESALLTYPVPAADIEVSCSFATQDWIRYVGETSEEGLSLFASGTEPDGRLNAHVDITFLLLDDAGETVGTLVIPAGAALSECAWEWTAGLPETCEDLQLVCSVSPVQEGSFDSAVLSTGVSVHVFHPVLTLQDTVQAPGEAADIQPGDYTDAEELPAHLVSLSWQCDDGMDPEELTGTDAGAPDLGIRAALTEGTEWDGEQYILCEEGEVPVVLGVFSVSDDALSVDITSYTEFYHLCSRDGCGYDPEVMGELGIRCLIHVVSESAAETETSSEDTVLTAASSSEAEESAAEASSSETAGAEDTVLPEIAAEESEEEAVDVEDTTWANERGDAQTQTGDDAEWVAWLFLTAFSFTGLVCCFLFRKRRG